MRCQLQKYYFSRTPILIIFLNLNHFSKSLIKIILHSHLFKFPRSKCFRILNLIFKKNEQCSNIFSFSFVQVPECAPCTISFSTLYKFQNVLLVHFLFQLCMCSGMCLLNFYIIHMSRNSILSLFYTS